MIADILRFNARAKAWLARHRTRADVTLGEFVAAGGYSRQFVEHYIVPMGRAIWSAEASAMLGFPARFFIDFFDRHGFLNVDDRPVWQTVHGRLARVRARAARGIARARVRLSTPVASIRRLPTQVLLRTRAGDVEAFDHVFLACHSDQALALLEAPTPRSATCSARCRTPPTRRSCTPMPALLPRRQLARAAWNYHLLRDPQEPVALTYDMNVLQGLRDAPARFLVTLNHRAAIDPSRDPASVPVRRIRSTRRRGVAAQARHRELNGAQRTYFCGAYWRSGFHEDGVVSAQAALAHFAEDLERAQLPLPRVG